MITQKMRKVLVEELRYFPNEVDEMHPAVKKNNEMSKF